MEFIVGNDLFEDFCGCLRDTRLTTAMLGVLDEDLTINSEYLLAVDKRSIPCILEVAQTCVSETGSTLCQYRECYLLEMIGGYLCLSSSEGPKATLDAYAEV